MKNSPVVGMTKSSRRQESFLNAGSIGFGELRTTGNEEHEACPSSRISVVLWGRRDAEGGEEKDALIRDPHSGDFDLQFAGKDPIGVV